jgi:hypothetical protein
MRTLLSTIAVVGVLVTASACDTGQASTNSKGARHAHHSKAPTPAPKPSNFAVVVNVKQKQCFGTAGCNLTYTVSLSADEIGKHLDGDYDIKYKVVGDESGPIIDTIEAHPHGRYDVPFENFAGTSSSFTKLHAVVLSVRKHQGF